MKFDEFLFSHLGEMGKYQKIQFALVCIPTIFTAMHALSWTFAAASVPYRCGFGSEEKYSPYYTSSSLVANNGLCNKVNGSINTECRYDECSFKNSTKCSTYVFDNSHIEQTAIGRFEIVCEARWLKAFIQAAYYIGQMAGSMIFGVLGDRIGRKKVFIIAIATQIVCGFAQAIAPTWWLYAIFRAGTGFSHPGIFVIAVVIGMELVGPKYRKLASVITGLFFAVGQCILGVAAMHFTDYQILHVVITAPALIFLTYWWIVPESARWLVTMRRFEDADQVLQKAARINKVTLPDEWWTLLDNEGSDSKEEENTVARKYGFSDLFKTPVLRKRALIVFYLWPVVSMVYYGLSMKSDILGGDLYINFIVGGAIEMPALFIVYLLIDRIGRRYVLAGGYAIAGIILLSNLFIPADAPTIISLAQLLISKGAITATYASIYTFSPELFPTVVRNSAMGVCSMIARIGAISASAISMWIVELLGKEYMIIPFGVMSLIATVLILVFLPETMGRSLPATIEEVEGKEGEELQPMSKDA